MNRLFKGFEKEVGYFRLSALLFVFMFLSFPLWGEPITYETVPLETQASFENIIGTDQFKIAYMPPAAEFNFYLDLWKGLKEEAAASGQEAFLLAPQKDNPAEQMDMLNGVINQDVSAIILSTHDEKSAAPLIRSAVDKGIVVIIVNTDILSYSAPVHGIIGYSQRKGTFNLGKYALSLSDGRAMNVGILEGEAGYHSQERVGGFEDAISGTDLKIVSRLNGHWNTVGGYYATLDMISENPEIQMIFAANDFEIIGAEAALKSIGKEDVLLFGNDGVSSINPYIAEGRISGTVYTDPRYMGKVAYQVVLDTMRSNFEGGFVETPTSLITAENIDTYMSDFESDEDSPLIRELEIVSEERPGFTNADGTGLHWDILREIYQPLGISVDISIVPLKRAQLMINNSRADVMLGHYHGEVEQMSFPQWHYGSHFVTALFKKDGFSWSGQESLIGKRVAWIRGADYGNFLSVKIDGEERNNHISPLLMLETDRIDVFLEDREVLFRTVNTEREVLRKIGFDLVNYHQETILELMLYPGFSDTPRGRILSKMYDDRFPVLLSSGKLKALYDKWDVEDFPFDSE